MIKARMRAGAAWSEALILNMSSKGLLVRSDRSPGRGSYLEIRRGAYVIVARVVWSNSGRFGVQTQDLVPADGLVCDPGGAAPSKKPAGAGLQDRRAAPRSLETHHETSRHKARTAEFIVVALACGLAAILIASNIHDMVARPFGAVQAALAAK